MFHGALWLKGQRLHVDRVITLIEAEREINKHNSGRSRIFGTCTKWMPESNFGFLTSDSPWISPFEVIFVHSKQVLCNQNAQLHQNETVAFDLDRRPDGSANALNVTSSFPSEDIPPWSLPKCETLEHGSLVPLFYVEHGYKSVGGSSQNDSFESMLTFACPSKNRCVPWLQKHSLRFPDVTFSCSTCDFTSTRYKCHQSTWKTGSCVKSMTFYGSQILHELNAKHQRTLNQELQRFFDEPIYTALEEVGIPKSLQKEILSFYGPFTSAAWHNSRRLPWQFRDLLHRYSSDPNFSIEKHPDSVFYALFSKMEQDTEKLCAATGLRCYSVSKIGRFNHAVHDFWNTKPMARSWTEYCRES